MRESVFLDAMEDVYATFGKKLPMKKVTDAVFERIENFPDEFMAYAKNRLRDLESLPQNVGRFLALELWPDFRGKRPELIAQKEYRCQLCGKLAGWREAYNPEFSEWKILKCPCNDSPKWANVVAWTDGMIHAEGWLTYSEAMTMFRKNGSAFSRKRLAAMVGHDEKPSAAHKAYMEEMEAGF